MVFIISFNFYIKGMRNSVLTYRSALGLFSKDKYKAVLEAIVNLIASIILGIFLGAEGIFIGTAISTLLVCLPCEAYIVFKYGFKRNSSTYYINYFIKMLIAFAMGFGLYFVINAIGLTGIYKLLAGMGLCFIIPNVTYFIIYRNKEECKELFDKVASKIIRHTKSHN